MVAHTQKKEWCAPNKRSAYMASELYTVSVYSSPQPACIRLGTLAMLWVFVSRKVEFQSVLFPFAFLYFTSCKSISHTQKKEEESTLVVVYIRHECVRVCIIVVVAGCTFSHCGEKIMYIAFCCCGYVPFTGLIGSII